MIEAGDQNDTFELITKKLSGTANSAETARLDEWISLSSANRQYFEHVKNIWDTSDILIDPTLINLSASFKKVLGRIQKVSSKRTIWYYWQKVAAFMILPLAVGIMILLYFNSTDTTFVNGIVYNEVYSTFGTRTSLRLSDSTLVWLNSGSSLRYPNKFQKGTRTVFLDGEAYFEVKSDVSWPFVVETSSLRVKATGTKFNVQEYNSDKTTEVTLVSGKVFVNKSESSNISTLISELNPNQHLYYNRITKEKYIVNEDSYEFIAWKDGKLIFRNEPLNKVFDRISLMYNVDIEIHGKEINDYRYHATFQDESLEEILKLLKLTAPISYMEVKRNPLPDGTFPKKKVIIFNEIPKIDN
jgi:transmembrane sensor